MDPLREKRAVSLSKSSLDGAQGLRVDAFEKPVLVSVSSAAASPPGAPMYDMIELLFFAYRDFVGDADRVLEKFSFGRAHHRVLHFVHRQPGLNVSQLLDILKITKQSLNRVLKDLLDQGFVEARPGAVDRRQRQLFVTPAGYDLAISLARVQSERFDRAFGAQGPSSKARAMSFLLSMIDEDQHADVVARFDSAVGPER